jgi:hypothetical protein
MYRLNQETQRLELHFEKSEYMALTEAQKAEIKSAFLWSKASGAWVSRSTNSHWRAEAIAQKLGHSKEEATGERLTYAEQLDRKTEKAEARAERFEEYAGNAADRAKKLQSALEHHRGDIAFFTQPIIAGHSGSRAFKNYRDRLYARFDKGMEEYKKSSYYQDRAATARATADSTKLKDRVYLDNRIKECNKSLKAYQEHIVSYENQLYRINNGEVILSWHDQKPITPERMEECIQERLEKYEYQQDKLDFFEDCLNSLGGIQYSKENVKKGDNVKIRGSWCRVLSANPTTVRILNSLGWDWMKYPYAEIQDHKAV